MDSAILVGVLVVKIKAVLFDLGGTLIDSTEFCDTFQRILRLKGIERSVRDVKRAMLEAELELKKEIGGGVPKDTDYYTRWNLGILHRLGIRGRDLELAEDIDKHWFDYMEVRVQPGAYELVKRPHRLRHQAWHSYKWLSIRS